MSSQKAVNTDPVNYMKNLLNYLDLKNSMNGISVTKSTKDVKTKSGDILGLNAVVLDLCQKNPEVADLVGRTAIERALVWQWLEYNSLYLVDAHASDVNLKELDAAVEKTAYFSGSSATIADILLYHSLYPTFKEMSFFEKERYSNLSRWFRLMQEDVKLRMKNSKIIFSVTPLYAGMSHG